MSKGLQVTAEGSNLAEDEAEDAGCDAHHEDAEHLRQREDDATE
jgi:hypothetical protein